MFSVICYVYDKVQLLKYYSFLIDGVSCTRVTHRLLILVQMKAADCTLQTNYLRKIIIILLCFYLYYVLIYNFYRHKNRSIWRDEWGILYYELI